MEKLESENMGNPSKILGHIWDKRENTLQVLINKIEEGKPVTKNTILSQLARVYDPLGIISLTLVEGKRIFRDACDEQKGWDTEISKPLVRDYFRWPKQLRQVKIPRSLVKDNRKVKSVKLYIFSDASDKACSSATIAVVEQGAEKVKVYSLLSQEFQRGIPQHLSLSLSEDKWLLIWLRMFAKL